MSPKKIVQDFYTSDALINPEIIKPFLHPEILLNWNSSNGLIQMNFENIVKLSNDLKNAYLKSKVKISQILQDKNCVTVQYEHFAKTFENPREEMLLGRFIVIWELKDDKLYLGNQISQKA
jgi:hypothetical protein